MTSGFDFPLDAFQIRAIQAFSEGYSVLVAAPTGSGKTVVAEAAMEQTVAAGGKVFYTTPIKALSNQKFADLSERFGSTSVGLLTGDNAIRGGAPVVVMTTEVLRNMIHADNPALRGLSVVVMDEVHYLQDAYRGPVWEEVIVGLGEQVRLVCLSATVSNHEELGAWIESVRGPTKTIVETVRPVELEVLFGVTDRQERTDHVVPMFVDDEPNPAGFDFDVDLRPHGSTRGGQNGRKKGGGGRQRRRFATPRRTAVADYLSEHDLLPSIYFLFSRDGCDDAAGQLRDSGVRFTTSEERTRIISILEHSVSSISDGDLDALDYDLFAEALGNGVAPHHAGMIPAFKEAVEKCFTTGLVKLVFATETLALGVNMPARSVVVEKLTKYNGETHVSLTPGQFTQLSGRAGRRGLDNEGSALVLWSPFVTFAEASTLASSTSFPLVSSFRPSYNMVANLARRYSHSDALGVLGSSFAEFQSSARTRLLQQRLDELADRDSRLQELSRCELGDVGQYVKLRNKAMGRARSPSSERAINEGIAALRPGDVVEPRFAADAPGTGPTYAVLSSSQRARGTSRSHLVDRSGEVHRVVAADLLTPPRSLVRFELAADFSPTDSHSIASLSGELGEFVSLNPPTTGPVPDPHTTRMEAHAVHGCPARDEHVEAFTKLDRSARDVRRARNRLLKRSGSIPERFDNICEILSELGFMDDWRLSADGAILVRIFHENDLLIALAARSGVLDQLDGASMAAVVSTMTYEDRRPNGQASAVLPTAEIRRRFGAVRSLGKRLVDMEQKRAMDVTRMPDPGFAESAWKWVKGQELSESLDPMMTGGDFVRNIRVLSDVMRQLSDVLADPAAARLAQETGESMLRGVVASTVTPPPVD